VGCDNGSLQLINIVSGVVSPPVTSSRLQYIEAVRYNPFQASMVAGATESGMVGIWDANANKIVHEFAEHRGPATGLVFSPVNAALMISTALDKKCVLYDSQCKQKLSAIRIADPVTSVDLNRDGSTLALGDMKGQVSMYDLRSTASPLYVYKPPGQTGISAATSSVTFLNNDLKSKRGGLPPKQKSTASSSKIYNDIKENIRQEESSGIGEQANKGTAISSSNNDSVSSLFSPLRGSSPAVTGGGAWRSPNLEPSSAGPPLRKLSTDSLFSPLRENTSIVNLEVGGGSGSFCRTPKTAPSSNFNSPLTSIKEESSPKKIQPATMPPSGAAVTPRLQVQIVDEVDRAAPPVLPLVRDVSQAHQTPRDRAPVAKTPTTTPKPIATSTKSAVSNGTSQKVDSQMSDIRAMMLAFPDTMSTAAASAAVSGAAAASAAADSSGQEEGEEQLGLHHKYLRAMQSEALDDFYTDIKRHLWHLDYTLVRNFQDMHDHIEQVRNDFRAQNEALQEENRKLREENEALKKTRKFYQA